MPFFIHILKIHCDLYLQGSSGASQVSDSPTSPSTGEKVNILYMLLSGCHMSFTAAFVSLFSIGQLQRGENV